MSEITKKIMKKVTEGAVTKIPKWRFVLKRTFVWGSLFVAIVLGAFAVSMVVFQVVMVDWDLLPRVAPRAGFGLFRLVPYFWLLVAVLLFVFVYFDFRNTRKGHRYSGGVVIGASLLVAFVLGLCMYFVNASEMAEDMFRKMPFYDDMHMGREMMWNAPDVGVLAGTVVAIEKGKVIVLEDMMEHVWDVGIENAKIGKGPKSRELVVGDNVKAIGKMIAPGKFEADEIRFGKGPF